MFPFKSLGDIEINWDIGINPYSPNVRGYRSVTLGEYGLSGSMRVIFLFGGQSCVSA